MKIKNFEQNIDIQPNIVTHGAIVNVQYQVLKDPFLYQEDDFTLGDSKIKLVYMSDTLFRGKLNLSIPSGYNDLSIKLNEELSIFTKLYTPITVVSQLIQLDHRVFSNTHHELIFLDHHSPSFLVLCRYNLQTKNCIQGVLQNNNINAIYMDSDDNIYATSIKDKTLYEINDALECNILAQGLGAPFGIVKDHQGNLFVTDQKGSLFHVENRAAHFLCDIPVSFKGYYLAMSSNNEIYISIPSYAGKNTIIAYDIGTQKITTVHETYHLLGDIAFDPYYFYWIEHTREQSIVYRKSHERHEISMFAAGQYFSGIYFDQQNQCLYLNDLHNIYKIDSEVLYG